jgi:hypothetical protein
MQTAERLREVAKIAKIAKIAKSLGATQQRDLTPKNAMKFWG